MGLVPRKAGARAPATALNNYSESLTPLEKELGTQVMNAMRLLVQIF